nr:UDP-N-acetylmuramoyl-L-alanyl-D-glutamate--2,6-diaminopimelate ligase [Candidatus Delongbacteria bacterium]
MKLSTILEGLSYRLSGNHLVSDLNILKITDDSNDVAPGSLFIARTGTQSDGRRFIPSAIEKGAIAVFSLPLDESLRSRYPHVLFIESDDVKPGMFLLARNFYRFDRYHLNMIGVTGTDGKTSFTYICESILKSLGHKTGIIGTINSRYLDQVIPVANTTPSFLKLHEMLSTMDLAGVDYVIMEASSHALDQQRVYGIDFQVAAFTNLKQDHLDYHHDMETYFQAKKRLFTHYCHGHSIINIDDEYGTRLEKELSDVWSIGFSPDAEFRIADCIYETGMTRFHLHNIPVTTNLIGLFNVYNVAQAMVAVHALGFPLADIARAVSSAEIVVPGRLQKVGSNVYVDYAHTPNALEKAIQSLYKIGWKNVITIFGCGGDRDRTKRPIMGKIAAELSSKCIVTSDNPRTEDPDAIIADIMKGITTSRAITIPN